MYGGGYNPAANMYGGGMNPGANLQEQITDNWINQNIPGGVNS